MIFKYVKKDIEQYQKKINFNEKLSNSLEEIFKTNNAIPKIDLASTIWLFITLVLFREKEKDKDKKIAENKINIIGYLESKDLWKSSIYNDTLEFKINV